MAKISKEFTIFLALLVLVALLPALGAYPVFVMKVMLYALFACAFNLLYAQPGTVNAISYVLLTGAALTALTMTVNLQEMVQVVRLSRRSAGAAQ